MIIWIASYPKSGNTWVRSFLTNYFSNNKDFNFSLLKKINKFPNISLFKELNINYKKFEEIASNWITMQDFINLQNKVVYLKTHNAMVTINGCKFTNKDNTIGFIYLVRDPRDVILSYADHLGINHQETFDLMTYNYSTEISTSDKNYRSVFLGSWASNYNSWKNFNISKGLIIKYEDLIKNTEKTFTQIIKYLSEIDNITINQEKIKRCIKNTNFSVLQNLETKTGFSEKGKNIFFRKGIIGDWKNNLDTKITKKIETIFYKEMKELKYL